VRESLDVFRDRGLSMAVLTNKPTNISNDIIAGLGLASHFFRIYGGNSFEQKKPHPIGIETLMREVSATKAETMMVGDSAIDIKTARNAGVRACGVTYGFQPETLAAEPPDILVDHFAELVAAVLGDAQTVIPVAQ
ncbi:MAG: HAD-IA family hydrolase, partial [Acidobacteria bacterium]|nr:HAD-IA family hydrolase [Acidobacteriota bacterium]